MQSKTWIAWNLFLACVPVALAYLLAIGAERFTLQKKRVPWYAWLPLGLLWFAFLPNTCYLFTEWRHYLFDPFFVGTRRYGPNGEALIQSARQGLVFLLYSAVGFLSLGLSIRPVHRLLRKAGQHPVWMAPPFFFLVSLGVYLGLILRLNSWELFLSPRHVLEIAGESLQNLRLIKVLILFAGTLWLLYLIVDIWVDGVKQRIEQARKT
ncbi:MAG TPA: DUF1361 domain-containing protein [Chthonomonadaceae bacterium]|nr:DUF1361 domain-containing protein [Chthonomonadaceae bacterium]